MKKNASRQLREGSRTCGSLILTDHLDEVMKLYNQAEDEIKMASGAIYKKDKNALIPSILTEYYARRKQAKNDMKQASTEQEYYEAILERRLKEMSK